MGAKLGEAFYEIGVEMAGFERDLEDLDRRFKSLSQKAMAPANSQLSSWEAQMEASEKATKRFNDQLGIKKLRSFGEGLKNAGRQLTLFLSIPAALGSFGLVKLASAQEEAVNKAAQTFKESAKEVERWADTSANAYGLTKAEALSYSSTMGQILSASGIARDEMAEMSLTLLKLSGDMASFNDIDPTEALQKLQSGLVGEVEPLRAVGVLLSEAAVKRKAVAEGIAAEGEALTDAQKVLARYQLILESTADQQGDFARTSESLANKQRIAAASAEDLGAKFGKILQPIFITGLDLAQDLVKRFDELDEAQKKWALGMAGAAVAAGPLLTVFGSLTTSAVTLGSVMAGMSAGGGPIASIGASLAAVGPAGGLAIAALAGVALQVGNVAYAYNKDLGRVREFVDELGRDITEFADTVRLVWQDFYQENKQDVDAFLDLMNQVSAWFAEKFLAAIWGGLQGFKLVFEGWMQITMISIKTVGRALRTDWEQVWIASIENVKTWFFDLEADIGRAFSGILEKAKDFLAKFGWITEGIREAIQSLQISLGQQITVFENAAARSRALAHDAHMNAVYSSLGGGSQGGLGGLSSTYGIFDKSAVADLGGVLDSGGSGSTGASIAPALTPSASKAEVASQAQALNFEILHGMAKGIRTPKGLASCAFFASQLIEQVAGIDVPGANGLGVAKELVDFLKGQNWKEVGRNQAKAGDLVYYRGPNYGALRFNEGGERVGYHVGVYAGDGRVIDSSGGVHARNRALGGNARILANPAVRGGQGAMGMPAFDQQMFDRFSELAEVAEKYYAATAKYHTDLARSLDPRTKIADFHSLTLRQFKLLGKEEQDRLKRIMDLTVARETAAEAEAAEQERRRLAGDQLRQAADAQWDQMRREERLSGKVTRVKRLQYEMEFGALKDLTAMEKTLMMVRAAALDKRDEANRFLEEQKQRIDALKSSVDQLLQTQMRELALYGETSREAKIRWEIENTGLRNASGWIKALLIANGIRLDQMDAEKKKAEELERQKQEQSRRYKDELVDLSDRLRAAFGWPEEAMLQMQLLREGLSETQVRSLVYFRGIVEGFERSREQIKRIADGASDAFAGAFENVLEGRFKSFFDSLLDGFRSLVRDMALEFVRSRLAESLMGLVNPGRSSIAAFTSPISMAAGAFANLPKFAAGGVIKAGQAAIVGDAGWEIIRPNQDTRVYSHEQSKAMLAGAGGGGMTMHFHIDMRGSSGNPAEIKAAMKRAAAEAFRGMGRQARRDGFS